MFTSPPEDTLAWNDDGVEGAYRFLRRVWKYAAENALALQAENEKVSKHSGTSSATASETLRDPRRDVHSLLRQANFDYERKQFNTVASAGMKMLNVLESEAVLSAPGEPRVALQLEAMGIMLRILFPIVPHITQALWDQLGYAGELQDSQWPQVDEAALVQEELELVLQVNGKLRGKLKVAATADRDVIEREAIADPNVQRHVAGKTIRKVVVVPGRLVNVVA